MIEVIKKEGIKKKGMYCPLNEEVLDEVSN